METRRIACWRGSARPLRRILLAGALAAPAITAAPAATATDAAAPAAVSPAEKGAFAPPVPVLRKLENGLQVAVFPDHRLPILQIQVLVPAGSAEEGPYETGVAAMTARLLTRGTTSRSAEQFGLAVETLGGNVSATSTRECAIVNGAFLARDLEAGLELVADAALNPTFPAQELEAARSDLANALVRRNVSITADEHAWALAFPGHPYGNPLSGTLQSLAGLSRQEVAQFHRECYRPDHTLIAIAGDVDPEQALAAVAEQFASWSGQGRALPGPPAPGAAGFRIRIVDDPNRLGAEIRLVVPMPGGAGDDYHGLTVAGQVLGGSPATTRLGSALGPGARASVLFQREARVLLVSVRASRDSAATAVGRLRAEVRRLAAKPPAEAEVAAARHVLTNGFPLQFDTPGGVLAQWMGDRFYGIPQHEAAIYLASIGAVKAADVQHAAARWLDSAVLVVVGPATVLEPQLASLGTVEVVPATAPPIALKSKPATDTSEPSPEQKQQGRRIVALALAAHGGVEKLRGIRDSSVEGDVVIVASDQEIAGKIREVRKEPARFLVVTELAGSRSTLALEGDHGWTKPAGQDTVIDQDSLEVAPLRNGFETDIVHLLLMAAGPASRVAYRGREAVLARPADVVEVVGGSGERRVLFLDGDSHRVIAMEENQGFESRGRSERRLYSDYRPVGGIPWPHHEDRLLDGERAMTLTLKRVTFNAGVPDSLFARPRASERDAGDWSRRTRK